MGYADKQGELLQSSEIVYTGAIFEIHKDKILTTRGHLATRDIIIHSGAATAVPIINDIDVILVKQYRHAAGQYLLEIPAGGLEKGEDPRDCIIRELQEEIGYKPNYVELLYSAYLAPGYSTEYLHTYLAKDLVPSKLTEDQDEEFEIVNINIHKLRDMILAGEVRDAKTIAAVLAVYSKYFS